MFFHDILQQKMDTYVHFIYKVSRSFPREELYGVTSQIRRASLSVILNYLEGYARQRRAVFLNFLQIAYGSLKESKYLIKFSRDEKYLSDSDYQQGIELADEIGAMLWRTIKKIEMDQ